MHTVRSVGCVAPVQYHFSLAREHDRRHLTIDEFWRGCGMLADPLTQTHHVQTRPQQADVPHTEARLRPRRLALLIL